MAHLSERHFDAKRRRETQQRDRTLAIASRANYAPELRERYNQNSSALPSSPQPPPLFESPRQLTAEELAEASRRCEQRVQLVRQSEARARRQQLAVEDERRERSEQAGAAAPALAAQRLRERRARQRLEREGDLELLIAEQASSVRAMNIARMLSPRFEEKVTFAPRVAPRSEEDQRVARLLESSTVGAFYK